MCLSVFFGDMYRGACTDQSWGNSCASICTDGEFNPELIARGSDSTQACLREMYADCS